jgi:hypothetical protein
LDPHWDSKKIKELAILTGIPELRIYKWNWDKKKKANL